MPSPVKEVEEENHSWDEEDTPLQDVAKAYVLKYISYSNLPNARNGLWFAKSEVVLPEFPITQSRNNDPNAQQIIESKFDSQTPF